MNATTEGTADLALANAYLGVTGDRARGTLTASARLTGTRAAPRIEGTAKIANGFFRSAESGFELRNIEAALAGSERSIAVTSLTATALSAFEAAQLAAAIARLSGLAAGPDILESLRSVLGIDALSAVTDPGGGTAVSAGTYVGRGVYVGFVQGADTAAGRATVDIDLNDRVKLRGEVAPTGDTKVGVVAEWEY